MLLKDAENIDESAIRLAWDLRSAPVKEISSPHRKLFPSTDPALPMHLIDIWYTHANNTVYLNLNDFQEGMLAHELTHAIVDHYLLVRPPHATAEILARCVDNHLSKTVLSYNTPERFLGFSN
jgi:hypothetical protein